MPAPLAPELGLTFREAKRQAEIQAELAARRHSRKLPRAIRAAVAADATQPSAPWYSPRGVPPR